MRASVSLLACLLAACPNAGTGPQDTDTSAGGTGGRDFAYFVNSTTPYTGTNLTCWTPGGGWVQQAAGEGCVADHTLNGEVHDFETEDPVPEATVKIWTSDDVTAQPDDEQQADGNGQFSTTVPSCTPIGYGTFTPAEWKETVDTYEVHQVFGYEGDRALDGEWVNSVSRSTANIIPSIIGIAWDESTGIIAGTAFDCDEEPIGYAQVFIHDGEQNPPATGEVFYFTDNNLPTDHQTRTDSNPENGLWVAVNVPVGTWTVDLYGYDGTAHALLGSTQLTIKAGSVNISNIYYGHGDGIAYPDSCLQACE